jgi:O-antigen/teichoic acid export membrane protein
MLEENDVRLIQSQALDWLNGVLTPLSIAAIALAAPFFRLWIGPTLGSAATPVAVILLVGAWVHGIGHIPSAIVVGRNRPDRLAKLLLAYLVPYMLLLYFCTLRFGIVGAAAAWTIRAAFDPILFVYTRPSVSDMRRVLVSASLVLGAMGAALALPSTGGAYWTALGAILASAVYQNRKVLLGMLTSLRNMHPGFGGAPATGGVLIR